MKKKCLIRLEKEETKGRLTKERNTKLMLDIKIEQK